MEFNRNQYFMVGVIILFMGVQLRLVDSVVLKEEASRVIASKLKGNNGGNTPAMMIQASLPVPTMRRTVQPPRWLGWTFISVGAVLILHSLAMSKPS